MVPEYIVGFDDDAASRAAADFTRDLAHGTGASVVAAHVYPSLAGMYPSPYGAAATFGMLVDPETDGEAKAAAEQLLTQAGDDVEQRALPGESVPRELHAIARADGASLLVVGATHRGPVGRLIPGSVAERLVHGAPCPVLVVPASDAPRAIATIGVAYDGRPEARRAARVAEALAKRTGASIRLIGAVDPDRAKVHLSRHLLEAVTTHMTRAVILAARRLRKRGLQVETEIVASPSGPAIVDACAKGIDLLVTGSRAYGPLRSVLLGGTSRHIVDHAPCPVLVIPRGTTVSLVAAETALATA